MGAAQISLFCRLNLYIVRSFLKMFFASFVAIIVFFGLLFILFFGIVGVMVASEETTIEPNSVLFIDLSKNFLDKKQENPILQIIGKEDEEVPSLFELTRLIERAKNDSSIKGIYI
ncbi:MAG: hypothetical protein ACKO8Q_08335, partial [Bacteroidota bacterium]